MAEDTSNIQATREINVGRITGKSSYELAKEAGTFTGTLEEYNNREAELYRLFNDYNEAKSKLEDAISKFGYAPNGSWFETQRMNNLDECNIPLRTYINVDYIDINSLPTGFTSDDSKLLFESVVTYMKNWEPSILKQTLTYTSNGKLCEYVRLQLANGSFSKDNWKPWASMAL